jgi:hypothetical protein
VGLTADQLEPKYSLLSDAKDRIADLTHLMTCVLRYDGFYDHPLDDLVTITLPTLITFVNKGIKTSSCMSHGYYRKS